MREKDEKDARHACFQLAKQLKTREQTHLVSLVLSGNSGVLQKTSKAEALVDKVVDGHQLTLHSVQSVDLTKSKQLSPI